jgi:hypothetical protein
VVERTLDGRTDTLKERTLGVAVFDRAPDYDTNQDPVVRNTAGQVRKRLAQYYVDAGEASEVRIELPPGSYVPEIYRTAAPQPRVEPEVVEAPRLPPRQRWTRLTVFLALATVAVAGLAGFQVWRTSDPRDVERFWAPLLRQSGAVVLCVGQGHTYKLGPEWDRQYEEAAASGSLPSGTTVPASDIVPTWDRYVGLSDVQALLRLATLFSRYEKPVELRGGRTTSLDDLRRRPVVLVGAFNNEWTLSLTGELRFYFESEPQNKLDLVKDRQRPDFRGWAVRSDLAAAQVPMDYAIVTRVFNLTTEKAVVVAAGVKGGGTSAASEFLTNPAWLAAALRGAPRDWAERNVQFVLAVKMFSGSPGPPSVVAAHFW